MVKADALSRRPDHKVGVERDNEDVVLLKPEWVRELSGRRGQVPAAQGDRAILKDIKDAVDLDEVVVKGVAALKDSPQTCHGAS